MKFLKIILVSSSICLCANSWALVDYSEAVPVNQSAIKTNSGDKNTRKELPASRASNSQNGFSFGVATEFSHQSISNEIKLNRTSLMLNIETPMNVWFKGSYWQTQAAGFSDADLNVTHKGNPEFLVGFNFLQVGTREDLATMDIYGGAELSAQSQLASSRTDQIYGIDLSKRFLDFALGLAFELRTTGKTKNTEDYDLGNIQRVKATLGWMVSNDIQFQSDFVTTSIGVGEGANALASKVQYSTLAPRLNLKLASLVDFTLGADFLIQRPKSEVNSLKLKINSFAPTGTSLVAGLGLSF